MREREREKSQLRYYNTFCVAGVSLSNERQERPVSLSLSLSLSSKAMHAQTLQGCQIQINK
jgi:hypothetical protein